jgi:hypothetical protein
MGMRSSFNYEDIEVTNEVGLVGFIDRFKSTFGKKDWYSKEMFEDVVRKDKGKVRVSFESWDDIKLISYWYEEELLFLYCIGKYIRGCVHWTFENDDEAGYVQFDGGKTMIVTGQMEWTELAPTNEMFGKRAVNDSDNEQTQEFKDFMLVEDI